jgi:hypothetical protein
MLRRAADQSAPMKALRRLRYRPALLRLCRDARHVGLRDDVRVDDALRVELLACWTKPRGSRCGQGMTRDGGNRPSRQLTGRTPLLREIVAEHGWPSHQIVGEAVAHAA